MKNYLAGILSIAGALAVSTVLSHDIHSLQSHVIRNATAAEMTSISIKTTEGNDGTYLTDGNGKTLYAFDSDTPGQSKCDEQCVKVWTPLTVPSGQSASAGGGANQSLLATIQRSDGSTQVTYKGMPLYYYSEDTGPGDVKGQGKTSFGGAWYLVTAEGFKLVPASDAENSNPPGGARTDTPNGTPSGVPSGSPSPTPSGSPSGVPNGGPEPTADGAPPSPPSGYVLGTNLNDVSDFSGLRCDSTGRCYSENWNTCGYYKCYSNGYCCDNCQRCYRSSGHGGSNCGYYRCYNNGYCCDSCGHCYRKHRGGGRH